MPSLLRGALFGYREKVVDVDLGHLRQPFAEP